MSEKNSVRLSKLVREFNVKIDRILDFLSEKGVSGLNPNSKISNELYMQLLEEFDSSKAAKISAQLLAKEQELKKAEEIIRIEKEEKEEKEKIEKSNLIKIKLKEVESKKIIEPKINEDATNQNDVIEKNDDLIKAKSTKLKGLTTTGQKIDLSKFDKPAVKKDTNTEDTKRKRKRILKKKIDPRSFNKFKKPPAKTVEISPEEAQKRVRETLAKLQGTGKKSSVKKDISLPV